MQNKKAIEISRKEKSYNVSVYLAKKHEIYLNYNHNHLLFIFIKVLRNYQYTLIFMSSINY